MSMNHAFFEPPKEQLYSNQDCLKEYFSKVFKNTYTYNKGDMLIKNPIFANGGFPSQT